MKLIILVGLPASGKSTKAAEILKASGNAVRINKDLLRTMLHFDKWTGANEKATRHAARELAQYFLRAGRTVVIDDTNLRPGTLQGWKDLAVSLGAHIEVVRVDTPFEKCIHRDALREKPVGEHVIVGMAMQYGSYPTPKNGLVICDLDGTLADIRHRLHFVEKTPKDWKGFFAAIPGDTLRDDVFGLLRAHEANGREIFFVSGRSEEHRSATEAWLAKAMRTNGLHYRFHRALFMRRAHDRRPDNIVKQEIYDAYFKPYAEHIVEVIDDRPRVIAMWRENGLNVLDVGSNDFFREEREALNYWTPGN